MQAIYFPRFYDDHPLAALVSGIRRRRYWGGFG